MIMLKDDLIAVVKDILAGIEANDSFEGTINYSCMHPAAKGAEFEVGAMYRVGNSMGQGGMVVIDNLPVEEPELVPVDNEEILQHAAETRDEFYKVTFAVLDEMAKDGTIKSAHA
jgi:hypothetical protein